MDAINLIFDRLDDWRHLPSYHLERRADIFFAIYLRDFLQDHLKVALQPQLVPEFPLHLKTINFGDANNQSVKVDYIAVSEDLSKVFFIELKTDMKSRNDGQDGYLDAAQKCEMKSLVEGIKTICAATKAKSKYGHLLGLLEQVGLVTIPPSLQEKLRTGQGMTRDELNNVVVRSIACKPDIWYLLPCAKRENEIGFDKFTDWLMKFGDPFSVRFRHSLQTWHADAKRSGTDK